jgi:hypothetical protein
MKKPLLIAIMAVSILAGCQTTGAGKLYSKDSISSKPYRTNYSSDLKYAIDLAIYSYPRRCVYVITQGLQVSENQRPDKFNFVQIIENKFKDGWYLAIVQPTESVYNALSLYVNGKTGNSACGANHLARVAPGLQFYNGKFFDVAGIRGGREPVVVKTPQGPVAALNAKKLCKLALGLKADSLGWNYSYSDFVNESHRRGFSVSDCRKHAGYVSTPSASKSTSASKSIEERLQKLKQLIDRGLITEDEAKAKRKEILGGL